MHDVLLDRIKVLLTQNDKLMNRILDLRDENESLKQISNTENS